MMQERAFEESQKYKEGKYILEKAKLMKVCHTGLTLLVSISNSTKAKGFEGP